MNYASHDDTQILVFENTIQFCLQNENDQSVKTWIGWEVFSDFTNIKMAIRKSTVRSSFSCRTIVPLMTAATWLFHNRLVLVHFCKPLPRPIACLAIIHSSTPFNWQAICCFPFSYIRRLVGLTETIVKRRMNWCGTRVHGIYMNRRRGNFNKFFVHTVFARISELIHK